MRTEITESAASAAHGLAAKGMGVNAVGATTLGASSAGLQWHWWSSETAAWIGMLVGACGVLVGLLMQYRAHRMRVKEHEARMRLLEAGRVDTQ